MAPYANHLIPVFVLGAFHSGTTILHRMLCMHPDATWMSQFSQRHGEIPGRRWIPLHSILDRGSRLLFEYDWTVSELRGIKRLMARPQEAQLVWKYVIPPHGMLVKDAAVERMHRVLDRESRTWKGRSHIIIKYPRLSRHVALLESACPNAKFVHIVRDGRAVALSLQHRRITRDRLTPSIQQTHQILENVARYWTDVMKDIDRERDSIDLLEVRYEDFCSDVVGYLRRIMRHIGLDEERFPFNRCPTVLTATNANWIDPAPPEALATLEAIQRHWLQIYAYR
jgi:hypothetical protein